MSKSPSMEQNSLLSGKDTPSTRKNGAPEPMVVEVGGGGAAATLKEKGPNSVWRVGVPIALIMIPLGYTVLLGIVASLHNAKESRFGNNVREVLQVASTVWPISFAAVLGPFLKTLALYRAEKGSTLGTLEYLANSQTTVAAVTNFMFFGQTHTWTIVIVALWALSPIGGQAAVRSLRLIPNQETSTVPVVHYLGSNMSDMNTFFAPNMTDPGDSGVFLMGSTRNEYLSDMRNHIAASFARPDITVSHSEPWSDNYTDAVNMLGGKTQASRAGVRDLWQNVRVPFLEQLPAYNKDDPDAWVSALTNDEVVPYASFIGIPIRGGSFSRPGKSKMVVPYHYQTVSCGHDFNGSDWLRADAGKLVFHNLTKLPINQQSRYQETPTVFPQIYVDVLNDTAWLQHAKGYQYPLEEPKEKLSLIIGGQCNLATKTDFLRVCTLSTTYVDVEIECDKATQNLGLECQAINVRHTPGYPINGNMTALSNIAAMTGMIWEFPFPTARSHFVQASLIEKYLKDPPTTLHNGASPYPGCFTDVPKEAWEVRFATALNTVFRASLNSSVISGGDGLSLENRNKMWKAKTATVEETTASLYRLSPGWYAVWLFSTLVLFVCAVANLTLRVVILAPDILTSIGGLTRDSPYIKLPQEGSGLDGMTRVLRMAKAEIRIGDIRPGAEVGKIALTNDPNAQALSSKRQYE